MVAAGASGGIGSATIRLFVTLVARAWRDARTRTLGFAYVFAAVSVIEPVAYRHTYPTLAERINFAHSFANNKAVVLFYGKAYDLLTVGGYTAWRMGGTLAIFGAVFGVLAAVRVLRAEEDAGRAELVLASPVRRATAFAASLAAIGAGTLVLWGAAFAGLLAGGLPAPGSAYLSVAVVSVIPVFAGAGALVSQLATNKRMAIELGGAIVAASLLLRVIADTSSGAAWLHWATPLGWAEELRPFTGDRPLVLLAPVLTGALLLAAAGRVARSRDIGTGVLASKDRAAPHLALLRSPLAQALRAERVGLLFWAAGAGALALVVGVVSKSVTSLGVSAQLEHALKRLGVGSTLTPKAYIGFAFSSLVLVVSLFAVSQIAAARQEEAEERLDTLLALPLSRHRWLADRLGLATAGAVGISVLAGLLAWVGAVSQGVSLGLPAMLGAGANCLPVAVLFLGVAGLAYAAFPRAGTGIAYGLVVVAYLWQLFGSLLGLPKWLVQATPFAQVGALPAGEFRAGAAAIMVGIGLLAGIGAMQAFRRRDLLGA